MLLPRTHVLHSSAACLLQSILKHEGPRGLYRGLLASLCGIIPYSGTDLTVFSLLKVSVMFEWLGTNCTTPLDNFAGLL